jgi:DedD protein
MPDQPVREIQLGGKQLVFLFMASVVLAVAIFLLGISVGRGVHNAGGGTTGTEVAVATDANGAPLPDMPPTQTTAADSVYHDQLQSATPSSPAAAQVAAATAAAAKPAEEPPSVAEDAPATTPAAPVAKTSAPPPPVPAPKPAEKPQEKPAAKPASDAPREASAPAAAATGTWFVQVDSFRSRENADRQAARLRAKSYAAAVSTAAGLYRVRVGPFAQRADAERVRQRLQREEGLKPSIQR